MSSSDSSSFSKGSPAVTVIATTGIIAGGTALIVITILIIEYLRKTKRQSVSAEEQLVIPSTRSSHHSTLRRELSIEMESLYKFLKDIDKEKHMRFTPQHLIHFTKNYAEKLGSGGLGVVYKGQFPNGMKVAVKVLHGTTSDKRTEEEFIAQISIISRSYHTNLVNLIGFCFDKTVKALVYEYMENGSLAYHLFDKSSNRIEWGKLLEIAIGTAKAISYLHEECQQNTVHYDIKPGNILLDENFNPKVADFGLAKLCDRENTCVTLTGAMGTPGYAAPELWMPLPVTHKCDVYSFGMILFEILGRRNLDVRRGESAEWYPKWAWHKFQQGELDTVISDSGVELKYKDKAKVMCKVALLCVQYYPESRPSMNSVVRMLEEEEEISMPSDPFYNLSSHV